MRETAPRPSPLPHLPAWRSSPCTGPASCSPSSAPPIAKPILPPVHHDAARMASSLASSLYRTEPCIRFLSISSQIAPSRLLPTIIFSLSIRREKTPHAVALRFTRRDQLVTGLTPAGVPPCWTRHAKGQHEACPFRIRELIPSKFANPILGKLRFSNTSPTLKNRLKLRHESHEPITSFRASQFR